MAVRRSVFIYLILISLPLLISIFGSAKTWGRYSVKGYLKEHFAGTDMGRKLNALFQNGVLQSPNVGNVHLGQAGWLFYLPRTDGNSIADFYGAVASDVVEPWSQYLKASLEKPFGLEAQYLFFVVPNKESIYSDQTRFMFPNQRYARAGNFAKMKTLVQSVLPANHLDAEAILLEGRGESDVYSRSDTHWSPWGSYLIHKAIIAAAGRLLNAPLVPLEPSKAQPQVESPGDIASMLGSIAPIVGYGPSGTTFDVNLQGACCVESVSYSKDVAILRNPTKRFVVWVVGDSFREKLIPFLPNYFGLTAFISIRSGAWIADMQSVLEKYGKPDLVIEERVERYLVNPPTYLMLR